jgi:hypothetical protein
MPTMEARWKATVSTAPVPARAGASTMAVVKAQTIQAYG